MRTTDDTSRLQAVPRIVTLQLQYKFSATLHYPSRLCASGCSLTAPFTRVFVRHVRHACRQQQGGQGGQIWPRQSRPKSRAARRSAAMDRRRQRRYRLGYRTYSHVTPTPKCAPHDKHLRARALLVWSPHLPHSDKRMLVRIGLSLTRRGRTKRDTSAHVSTHSCLIRQVPTYHIR